MNKGRDKINKYQELKNKWNFKASKTIVDMVIKRIYLSGNRTPVTYNVVKHATNWTAVDNEISLLLGDLWSNSEASGK
jgi:hypothetical protein